MPTKTRGVAEVIAKLAALPAGLQGANVASMHAAVRLVERDLKLVSLTAPRPAPLVIRRGRTELVLARGGVGGLAANSGDLRASVVAEVLPAVAGKVVGVVGTSASWAWVHEYGAVIRAKGRGLAIPVAVQRHGTAARRSAAGKSAVGGRGRRVIIVKSVTIPARRPHGQTVDRTAAPVSALFEGGARQFVRSVGGGA